MALRDLRRHGRVQLVSNRATRIRYTPTPLGSPISRFSSSSPPISDRGQRLPAAGRQLLGHQFPAKFLIRVLSKNLRYTLILEIKKGCTLICE